jgi:hypothetical protein
MAVSRCDVFHAVAKGTATEKHRLKGRAQPVDLHFRPAATSHPDHIKADEVGERPLHQPERDYISAHPAHTHNHGAFANPHELPYRRLPSKNDEIADRDVAAQDDIVCESDIVSNLTVMPDMRPDHEKTAVSYFGYTSIVFGPGIHCDTLADIAIGANDEPGGSAAILHRLGRAS